MLSLLVLASLLHSQSPEPSATDGDPRLIVLVSVDQMIPEQLRRLAPWLEGGLGRFLEAEVWENAHHAHGFSDTAPGHATLGTGTHPARHGVIANAWLSGESGASVYCVGDPTAQLVGDPRPGVHPGPSARSLRVAGLADHVKALDPRAVTVSIAGKDRAAVLAGGRELDLCLWWNRPIGGFVSSDAFTEALPEWVADWNRRWIERTASVSWERLDLDLEGSGTAPDDRSGERPGDSTFPHRAPGPAPPGETLALGRWVFSSPWIDEFALELAIEATERLELGRDDSVDYLFVGLSACDTVGHGFGPYSAEVTDVLLRADRGLERLFRHLDEHVGKGRWVAALSSDHGVARLPEALQEEGIPAKRYSLKEAGAGLSELQKSLDETFGEGLLLGVSWRGLRFSHERLGELGVELATVEAFAAERLEEAEFIERVFARTELEAWSPEQLGRDPVLDLMARAYDAERSFDLAFVFRPWALFDTSGTSHGSPWPYDRRIPLAFLGPGHRPGHHHTRVHATDVCPTLLHRAGLPLPEGLDGRILR